MEVLFFIVDTACNRKCPYCFYETGYLPRTPLETSESDWLKVIDEAGELGVRNIIITGGEPLMGGESRIAMLEKIFKRINYHGMSSLLITNGYFLTPDIAGRLAQAKLGAVSIGQDSLSGVEGYKLKGWKAVEAALREGLRVTLITAVTRENYVEIPAIYRFAASRRLGLILQPSFVPREHPRFEELSLEAMNTTTQQRILDAILQWADGFGLVDYQAYLKALFNRPGGKRPTKCEMGTAAGVIDADGSFYPCFHRRDLRVGNIKSESLRSLLSRCEAVSAEVSNAPCWGIHCVSLFAGS